MQNLINQKERIEAEHAQPLVDVIRGYAADGESARTIAAILGIPARRPAEEVRQFCLLHGIRLPAITRNPIPRRRPHLDRQAVLARKVAARARLLDHPRPGYRDGLTINGRTQLLTQWAEELGHVGPDVRRVTKAWTMRLRRGTDPETAITTPVTRKTPCK